MENKTSKTNVFKEIWYKNKDKLAFFGQLTTIIAIYGVLIAFAADQVFGFSFTIGRAIGFGVVSYFLKHEIPIIIKSSFK